MFTNKISSFRSAEQSAKAVASICFSLDRNSTNDVNVIIEDGDSENRERLLQMWIERGLV